MCQGQFGDGRGARVTGPVDGHRVSGQRASGARAFEWGVARVSLD